MANAVTFWKGTLAKYQEKVTGNKLVEGRLYFIEDSANPTTMGALYLKNQLIAPQRLTALGLDTTDNVSSVTARAVVDFVTANFDAKGAYDSAIKGINDKLAGITGTVADAISGAVSEAKGTIDAYTVNGKAISSNPSLAAADIDDVYSKTEVDDAIESAIEAVIGSEGDLTLGGINDRLETVEGKLADVDGKVGAAITTAVSGLETTINGKLDGKVDNSTYTGKISTIEGRLTTTEGVANDAAAAVATKVEQSDYNAKVGAYDAILAGFGTEDDQTPTVAEAIADVKAIASAAMEFKGVVADMDALNAITKMENGDIYYVKADDTEYVYIADKEVAEGDSKWEALGGYVKADVYTKSETNTLLSGKLDTLSDDTPEGDVIIAGADGAIADSGYTLGGATLGTTTGEGEEAVTTYSATKLATEKAVKDSIDEAISAALMWVED